jgi:hypothetical protein
MVILSKNKTEKALTTARFAEVMADFRSGKEIISGQRIDNLSEIKVPALSAMIIELK